jgi:ribosomal protein S25
VGYGAFQSTLNEIRDKVVEIQKVLEHDVAKERSVEEVSKKIETVSKLYEQHKSLVPAELAQETRRRIVEAGLSARLMETYAVVKDCGVITPAELATRLDLRSNTCSQYLNELASRGFIKKLAYGKFCVHDRQPEPTQNASDWSQDAV